MTLDELNKRHGGLAFPLTFDEPDGSKTVQLGMTMRDWFAGQALVGILAAHANPNATNTDFEPCARDAYVLADFMLAERSKGSKP